ADRAGITRTRSPGEIARRAQQSNGHWLQRGFDAHCSDRLFTAKHGEKCRVPSTSCVRPSSTWNVSDMVWSVRIKRLTRLLLGQPLSGQHLIAHRRVVEQRGNDDGCLAQVFRDQAIIRVTVRMMRASVVLERILNDRWRRNSGVSEWTAIAWTPSPRRHEDHAEVAERRHPLPKNGHERSVAR